MQLTSITRKSAAMALLLLIAMLVATAVRYLLSPFEIEVACGYNESVSHLVIAMMLLFFGGVTEGRALMRSGLSNAYCTLPMPIYGVLAYGVFVAPNALSVATASLCFALTLNLLMRSLHHADEKDTVFMASILLGTTVLLYAPCVVLVAIIPLAIFILALSLRQSVLMVVGYLLPLLAASYVVWYGGGGIFDFWEDLFLMLSTPRDVAVSQLPYVSLAIAALVAISLIWGVIYSIVRSGDTSLPARTRRALNLFVWAMVVSFAMLLFPCADISVCALVAVPTTILLSVVLCILPNNHSTIAYWLLLTLFVAHLFVA